MKAANPYVLPLLCVLAMLSGHLVLAVEVGNSADRHHGVAVGSSGDMHQVSIPHDTSPEENLMESSDLKDSRSSLMRSEHLDSQAPNTTGQAANTTGQAPNATASVSNKSPADNLPERPWVVRNVAQPPAATTSIPPAPAKNAKAHPLVAISSIILLAFTCYISNYLYTRKQLAAEAAEAGAPAATGEGTAPVLGDDESDGEQLKVEPLPEDTYGMVIAAMVRDMQHLASGSKHKNIRVARIFSSWGLLLANLIIQILVLTYITKFAAARAVHNIRGAYDVFEVTLYDNHVYKTANGWARGSDDVFFKRDNFAKLSDDAKENACRIPFSQPGYLAIVLFVWTLLILGDLRQTLLLFVRLVLGTGSTTTMAESCTNADDGDEMIITKLTRPVKAVISVFIILPRLFIAGYLLWLGCRWLAATNDFQSLILNSVALEFVLLTKELLFNTLVSNRSQRDTRRMVVSVEQEAVNPSPWSFLGAFLWGICALGWVYLYMYDLQQVLPEYRWDVRDVCTQWIEDNFSGKN
eukprot:TRINITY_DN1255_c0_g3_i1.p1 TRINITY_DN1255_c0_g3~~TRINITY_DN1255_c0_g3_i1.p1  ORF type:complete len:524 (-),score=85.39 TRINITY_DN1255_c0_g3_i1:44-1615(-)